MRFRYVLPAVLLFLMTAVAQPQSAVCSTHFYNNSNYKWSIYNADGQRNTLFIQPNTTVTINWGTTSAITVTGYIPSHPYKQQLQVQPANSCVVLQPYSSSALTVNKPGNGDFTTCAGGC
jgi:hypothetical protein